MTKSGVDRKIIAKGDPRILKAVEVGKPTAIILPPYRPINWDVSEEDAMIFPQLRAGKASK